MIRFDKLKVGSGGEFSMTKKQKLAMSAGLALATIFSTGVLYFTSYADTYGYTSNNSQRADAAPAAARPANARPVTIDDFPVAGSY
jgi:hypothetical protein